MSIRWLTIFLDFPGRDFGAGVAFWREVTGSELSPYRGEAGEFATLLPSDGDAYLRVQRISEGIGGCHLDLHVDPVDAGKPAPGTACPLTSTSPARPPKRLAEQHVALGGQILSVFPSWLAMADPTGRQYCLTTRSPGAGRLPDTKTA